MIIAYDTESLEVQVNILDDAVTSLRDTAKELAKYGFGELAGHLRSVLPDLEAELEPIKERLFEAYDHQGKQEYGYWR